MQNKSHICTHNFAYMQNFSHICKISRIYARIISHICKIFRKVEITNFLAAGNVAGTDWLNAAGSKRLRGLATLAS